MGVGSRREAVDHVPQAGGAGAIDRNGDVVDVPGLTRAGRSGFA